MINIVKKELEFDDELKKKIEFICGFCNTTPTIINGNIRKIDRTNLSYIEPHRIIIKGITISVNEMNNTQKNIEYNPNVVLTALMKNGLD
ncbi:hypothetical protein IJV57_02165 [Candidatus Saccharibacteria bacterium]|nr:hypothetical protein [Candidatus Saccharibacteria bacterium]